METSGLCFTLTASSPTSGHHQKGFGSLLFTLTFQEFTCIDQTCLEPSQVEQFHLFKPLLTGEMLQSPLQPFAGLSLVVLYLSCDKHNAPDAASVGLSRAVLR